MSIGDYTIKAIVFSGSARFFSESVSFSIISPTVVAAPTAAAPPAAPAAPVITATDINTNPEEAATTLTSLVETGRVEAAAEAVAAAEREAAAESLLTVAETNPEAAAEILERVEPEDGAEIFEAMINLGQPERAAEILAQMDPDDAAKALDRLVVRNVSAAISLMERVPATNRATILAQIVRLPATPEKAAAILEEMTLEKAVESVEYMVKLGYVSEAGLAVSYLSAERLEAVWSELTATTKDKIIPYMTVEALSELKLLFRAKTANLLIISAGATESVSYAKETGAELELTAKEYTAGIVKTAQYVINPYKEASTPKGITLKKFLYIETAFPEGTISSTTLTIHYENDEVKGLLEFTLTVYKYDSESNSWISLPTTVNLEENNATTTIEGILKSPNFILEKGETANEFYGKLRSLYLPEILNKRV
jgi:flagellar motility protein MotE (MotC chaperone)